MEAKDTVLRPSEVLPILNKKALLPPFYTNLGKVLEAQAEITGKIMERQGYDKGVKDRLREVDALIARLKTVKQAGIREVVEWIENNGITQTDRWGNTIKGFWISMPADPNFKNEWQAKLKEWGIE